MEVPIIFYHQDVTARAIFLIIFCTWPLTSHSSWVQVATWSASVYTACKVTGNMSQSALRTRCVKWNWFFMSWNQSIFFI